MNKHEMMQWIKRHKESIIVGLIVVGSVALGVRAGMKDTAKDIPIDLPDQINKPRELDVSNFTIGEWAEAGVWKDEWDGYFNSIVNEVPLEKLGEFGQMIVDNCKEFGPEDHVQMLMDIRRYYPGD